MSIRLYSDQIIDRKQAHLKENKSFKLVISLLVFLLTVGLCSSDAVGSDLTIGAGGRVSVELISSSADFHNTLSVVSPAVTVAATGCKLEPSDGLPGVRLLSEKLSQRGCRVELDADSSLPGIQPFAAGTTFRFNFCAQANADPACEFVWSSNPTLNSDSFDHLMTTPIRPAEFPGQIYRLAWEDLPSGGDMDFNDLIVVLRVNVDSDGDGLWDDWETFGVDTDGDGTIDLNLPAMGANPMHKDVFLEIDFMDCALAGGDCAMGDTHSHRPKMAAVNAAIQAFADAPVMNPDGMTGITLHVDISNAIPHQNALNIPNLCFSPGPGIGSFDAVKSDPVNFGPTNPRRFAFRYVLFTHRQSPTSSSSGCGELPGNDFQVSLGGWNVGAGDMDGDGLPDADVGTIQQQAGTLMHEFGHNLKLGHGGSDSVNRKPNYFSIMSYAFQIPGIPPTDPDGAGPLTARVDYSRAALADLDESSLNEPSGIGDGGDNTRFTCPGGTPGTGPGTGAIDWNCNSLATELGVSVNLNNDGVLGILKGFNDWANLKFDFQNTGDFDDGDHSLSEKVSEIDYVTHLQIAFDISLQENSSPPLFQFNSATGDYQFTKCGPGGFTLTGRGLVTRRGSTYTLQHNTSDRRVLATIDKSVNRGSASAQVFSLGTTFTITDRDLTNNTRICP